MTRRVEKNSKQHNTLQVSYKFEPLLHIENNVFQIRHRSFAKDDDGQIYFAPIGRKSSDCEKWRRVLSRLLILHTCVYV